LPLNFDIIIPRKLRAPHNLEIAIGAVTEDSTCYLNEDLIRHLEISQEYLDREKREQIEEIKRRTSLYTKFSLLNKVKDENEVVILVDDGAATGATIIAAARWLRRNHDLKRLIIAIPVAPKDTVSKLKKEADDVEVISSPSTVSFRSVAQYYKSFEQVTDEQVISIMKVRKLL
jgi:putative phosphoribosyl transferase